MKLSVYLNDKIRTVYSFYRNDSAYYFNQSVYTASEAERCLRINKIFYSQKRTSYDNTGIEYFHASLKKKKPIRVFIQILKK